MTECNSQTPVPAVTNASLAEATHKHVGGSKSDDFNRMLVSQLADSLWLSGKNNETQGKLITASMLALVGIAPGDETEGMIATQMVAAHHAAMECHRRAMLADQTFEERREALNQANRLSRTYVTLLEALNRHRGKGQQKIVVERVNVSAGGQAIVGAIEAGGTRHGGRGKND